MEIIKLKKINFCLGFIGIFFIWSALILTILVINFWGVQELNPIPFHITIPLNILLSILPLYFTLRIKDKFYLQCLFCGLIGLVILRGFDFFWDLSIIISTIFQIPGYDFSNIVSIGIFHNFFINGLLTESEFNYLFIYYWSNLL